MATDEESSQGNAWGNKKAGASSQMESAKPVFGDFNDPDVPPLVAARINQSIGMRKDHGSGYWVAP